MNMINTVTSNIESTGYYELFSKDSIVRDKVIEALIESSVKNCGEEISDEKLLKREDYKIWGKIAGLMTGYGFKGGKYKYNSWLKFYNDYCNTIETKEYAKSILVSALFSLEKYAITVVQEKYDEDRNATQGKVRSRDIIINSSEETTADKKYRTRIRTIKLLTILAILPIIDEETEELRINYTHIKNSFIYDILHIFKSGDLNLKETLVEIMRIFIPESSIDDFKSVNPDQMSICIDDLLNIIFISIKIYMLYTTVPSALIAFDNSEDITATLYKAVRNIMVKFRTTCLLKFKNYCTSLFEHQYKVLDLNEGSKLNNRLYTDVINYYKYKTGRLSGEDLKYTLDRYYKNTSDSGNSNVLERISEDKSIFNDTEAMDLLKEGDVPEIFNNILKPTFNRAGYLKPEFLKGENPKPIFEQVIPDSLSNQYDLNVKYNIREIMTGQGNIIFTLTYNDAGVMLIIDNFTSNKETSVYGMTFESVDASNCESMYVPNSSAQLVVLVDYWLQTKAKYLEMVQNPECVYNAPNCVELNSMAISDKTLDCISSLTGCSSKMSNKVLNEDKQVRDALWNAYTYMDFYIDTNSTAYYARSEDDEDTSESVETESTDKDDDKVISVANVSFNEKEYNALTDLIFVKPTVRRYKLKNINQNEKTKKMAESFNIKLEPNETLVLSKMHKPPYADMINKESCKCLCWVTLRIETSKYTNNFDEKEQDIISYDVVEEENKKNTNTISNDSIEHDVNDQSSSTEKQKVISQTNTHEPEQLKVNEYIVCKTDNVQYTKETLSGMLLTHNTHVFKNMNKKSKKKDSHQTREEFENSVALPLLSTNYINRVMLDYSKVEEVEGLVSYNPADDLFEFMGR